VADTQELRGQKLYEALIALKPAELAETEWAVNAGLNRAFFTNLKAKDTSPRSDNLAKLLGYIGKNQADLGSAASTAIPFRMEGASSDRMSHDVPVYGTALGADQVLDGEHIEQTMLYSDEVIGHLRRPVLLDGRADIYGVYVQGSSMAPRFRDGETAFVERKRPASVGDDVVVYLVTPDDDGDGDKMQAVLIKTLVRKSASFIELEQYNPPVSFRLDRKAVRQIDRVVPWSELVA